MVGEGRNRGQFHREAFRCCHCVMADSRSKANERGKAPVGRTEAGVTKNQGMGRGKERDTREVQSTFKSPLGDTSTMAFRLAESRPLNEDPSVPR